MIGDTVRHRRVQRLAASAMMFLLAACAGSTAPSDFGGLTAIARYGRVHLENHTASPVFTFVVGSEMAARINWAPCADAQRCPPIEPGHDHDVPYPESFDGVVEHEAIVYWWHAIRGADGALRPDSIRAGRVRLCGASRATALGVTITC